ncbi:phosphate ABC transporter permease [Desulforamulus profundi]|uniref:Phosphate transport system permease protein PstA n=1 Tax=Desulforamulus profundi TaxID=1383067 RepID=A0A2C6MI52_9FIRM|nr:phosphate ABC transporter permease PstA [Desulforamulus profundi]MCL4440727.1 phosphate ABC transporter permease PstA [Bacillota bacterium]MCL5779828.1 phosphate ABC transporter permease PstA [Bacillota bacterium]PHJ39203.1 phosphate ABC transporter permease [Desulforamulus profundi]
MERVRSAVYLEEKIARGFLWASVLVTLGAMLAIVFHILEQGLVHVNWTFLTDEPRFMGKEGGIFPTIVSTVYLILLSLAIATPIGIMAAIQLTEYTQKGPLVKTIRFATETLAGIPSIIFGLFGFAFLVLFMGFSWSLLSGGLTLAFMVLPTIVRTSEEAIKSVPLSYREGSMALGATKWQTVWKIVLPSALPGIVTGVILSIGRVVGETAAVILTAGSSLNIPTSVMDPARSMSVHLYILAMEGISMEKAYATAAVLIILIFIINTIANRIMRKMSSNLAA